MRPHAVLLDLVMPGQDGFYLLERIKVFGDNHQWRPRVVVITGLRGPDLERELEQSGVCYLPKPFTPRGLFQAVQQASQPLSLSEKHFECMPNAA